MSSSRAETGRSIKSSAVMWWRRAAAGPPLLVVVPNQDLADELYGDVLFFQGLLGHRKNPPSLFPDWGILPYAPTPPPVEVIGKRMQVLDLIQRGESNMVIAPV